MLHAPATNKINMLAALMGGFFCDYRKITANKFSLLPQKKIRGPDTWMRTRFRQIVHQDAFDRPQIVAEPQKCHAREAGRRVVAGVELHQCVGAKIEWPGDA